MWPVLREQSTPTPAPQHGQWQASTQACVTRKQRCPIRIMVSLGLRLRHGARTLSNAHDR